MFGLCICASVYLSICAAVAVVYSTLSSSASTGWCWEAHSSCCERLGKLSLVLVSRDNLLLLVHLRTSCAMITRSWLGLEDQSRKASVPSLVYVRVTGTEFWVSFQPRPWSSLVQMSDTLSTLVGDSRCEHFTLQ